MGKTLEFEMRFRDIVVGGVACLLFNIMAHYSGQLPVLSTLAAIVFGYVAGLASMHLWSPLVTAQSSSVEPLLVRNE